MSFTNQSFTIHSLEHDKPVRDCEYCPAYAQTAGYYSVLRQGFWSLLEQYPDLYDLSDYIKACEKVGISIF